MIESLFKNLCPNCGGDISSERLGLGLPCERCMPKVGDYCRGLLREGELTKLCHVEAQLRLWEEHFESYVRSKPWSLQLSWAKRVFLGNSFGLLAPTGVGKTSFGLSMASYLAKRGKRSYIILPTRLLVDQTVQRLFNFGLEEREILYFSEDSQKQKDIKKARLQEGDFKVLATTSMFLYKNQETIPRNFDFVFVDDVDAFLKTAKNIDKLLLLLGFSQEDIELAMRLIRLKERRGKDEEDWEGIKELSQRVRELSEKRKGVLVVSSATSNPRSNRIKLFRELLGFEVGTPTFYLRNVVDLHEDIDTRPIEEWVRLLGKGGLLFIPSDKRKEYVDEVIESLQDKGIRAVSYESVDERVLREYEEGKIDLLVGIASYRNPLARGIDLPHVIRYALFYGVPKIVISLRFEQNLSHLLWALMSIRSLVAKNMPDRLRNIDRWLESLRRYQYLSEDFLRDKPELVERINRLRADVGRFLAEEEILRLMQTSEEITLRKTEDGYQMVVSDATGYLQASGRVSRMFAGGISRGVSLVLVDDKKAFRHLIKKIKWFNEDIRFESVKDIDLKELLEEVDRDREKIRRFLSGEEKPESRELLKPVLVVVESPNKARTIAGFFGKAVRRRVGEHELLETSTEDRYIMITASLGHVLDLNKEEGFHGVYMNGKPVPVYETIEGKERILQSLRRMAIEAQEILIATDPDTEGEKIGWDVAQVLRAHNPNIKRMEFHEVTKKAIKKALKETRDFNLNLVKAQVLRRVADRWVGFEFSKLLQSTFGKQWLSAGRVQTPVLGWIIQREREYRQKVYKVVVPVDEGGKLRVDWSFENKEEAETFYSMLSQIRVELIEEKQELKNPPPPFSTDTMLKSASDIYRWSLPKTMNLAQTLFELGYITYHRTDSTRVSDYGIGLAKEYIREEFGEEYFHARVWGEGGAHECIRPTKGIDPEELRALFLSGQAEGLSREHILLYELIFRQFMASQMRPVKLRVYKLHILADGREKEVEVPVEVLEDGWNRLIPLEVYKPILGSVDVSERKKLLSQPKAYLYTHGELVQEMKRRGIGRPSTYASIVEKLIERGYVIENKGFLIPTKLGKEVYSYLQSREEVHEFLKEEFTRRLEELMDKVEEGKEDYADILKDLYRSIIELDKKLEVV
ncbi:reverse gyrase [Pampinifervens florentissimum]|uniref:reverse gyrase n=1 Tax=Pampinifervens florentissimum TaxID=1632019 RepID=UPI0013B49E36|nr:reverse gyrase [Hydrogenobacter sp. T-8]QID34154.1 reverse gyrase [Hydrogenobacter sp. T-8]